MHVKALSTDRILQIILSIPQVEQSLINSRVFLR